MTGFAAGFLAGFLAFSTAFGLALDLGFGGATLLLLAFALISGWAFTLGFFAGCGAAFG